MNPLQLVRDPPPTHLRDHLIQDPGLHLYALGDLAEPFASRCSWWGVRAHDSHALHCVVVRFDDGATGSLLGMFGPTQHTHFAHLITHAHQEFGDRPHALLSPDALPIMAPYFSPQHVLPHLRMMRQRDALIPRSALQDVIHLDRSHTKEIQAFLKTHYPATFLNQDALDAGVTTAVRGPHGDLIALCGIHVVAQSEHVAALGNVVTHPNHRGQGLAAHTISATCHALIDQGITHIGLNVMSSNTSAIRCYEKLGFHTTHDFIECDLIRRHT